MLDTTNDKAPLRGIAGHIDDCDDCGGLQMSTISPRNSTILNANLAWMKLPYLSWTPSLEWPDLVSWGHKLHQSTSKWISYTVFCEVLCLIPKSEVLPAETLNFAPQVGWRHHQVRKEISCRKWPRHVTRLTRFGPAVCEGLGRSRKRWVAPVAPAYPYERRRTLMMTCTVPERVEQVY